MLLNNVPVAQGLFVNAFGQLNSVQMYNIERIELIRGPGSAVYGTDALTGVINIVTKTATDINGTELGARAGSFDTYDGWFLHGGQYGGFDVASAHRAGRRSRPSKRMPRRDSMRSSEHVPLAPSSINVGKNLIDAQPMYREVHGPCAPVTSGN